MVRHWRPFVSVSPIAPPILRVYFRPSIGLSYIRCTTTG